MDEIQLLRSIGDKLDPGPGSAPVFRRQPPAKQVRLRRWLLAPTLAAAGLAVGAMAVASLSPRGESHAHTTVSTPELPRYNLAAMVLNTAATATGDRAVPRPDQYIYIETQVTGAAPPPGTNPEDNVVTTRSWLSADGRHDGLVGTAVPDGNGLTQLPDPGCVNGHQPRLLPDGTVDADHQVACVPNPAFDPAIPTTTASMYSFLYKMEPVMAAADATNDENAFENAITLLTSKYLSQPQEVAVYRALAHVPGLTATEHATDPFHRPAIAVNRTENGAVVTIYFDPTTHQVAGWQTDAPIGIANRTHVISEVLVRMSIVNKAGGLP